jgi:NAD(P)-dependent dehydrogenase (short-subunit alcohol dehydrogenase family)
MVPRKQGKQKVIKSDDQIIKLILTNKKGLIVNITSMGGQQYAFNAAYGIGKAGVDRMSRNQTF